jgi:hypothetical protein
MWMVDAVINKKSRMIVIHGEWTYGVDVISSNGDVVIPAMTWNDSIN